MDLSERCYNVASAFRRALLTKNPAALLQAVADFHASPEHQHVALCALRADLDIDDPPSYLDVIEQAELLLLQNAGNRAK
jgi:hypothetical protein